MRNKRPMAEDVGDVGSSSKIALSQEPGVAHIPPCSFLDGAARTREDDIHALHAEALHKAVLGS